MNITELFIALIPTDKISKSGWYQLDCPCCGDNRRKGSFLPTETGGFRYKCWWASCEYNTATGWEPGSPISERVSALYTALGGNADPLKQIDPHHAKLVTRYGDQVREYLLEMKNIRKNIIGSRGGSL